MATDVVDYSLKGAWVSRDRGLFTLSYGRGRGRYSTTRRGASSCPDENAEDADGGTGVDADSIARLTEEAVEDYYLWPGQAPTPMIRGAAAGEQWQW